MWGKLSWTRKCGQPRERSGGRWRLESSLHSECAVCVCVCGGAMDGAQAGEGVGELGALPACLVYSVIPLRDACISQHAFVFDFTYLAPL